MSLTLTCTSHADITVSVFTEEECVIIEPDHITAPPTGECQSPSQTTEEVATSLLHLGRVVVSSAPGVGAQQPVAMETEEDVAVAAKEVKDKQEEVVNEGEAANGAQCLKGSLVEEEHSDGRNRMSQESHHKDVQHDNFKGEEQEETAAPTEGEADEEKEVKHILANVPSAIQIITSTAAPQGTNTEDHRASPLEDHHNSHRTAPLLQTIKTSPALSYSSHKSSPLQDYVPNIQGENYKIHTALFPASPDVIEVHSDKSEENNSDDMNGDGEHDEKDFLSQRSLEAEMFDLTRGNLGLLEQAIALKAKQVKPAGPRELFCAPDIHHQRYITMDDRPKHLDVIRKSYFGKGRAEKTRTNTLALVQSQNSI